MRWREAPRAPAGGGTTGRAAWWVGVAALALTAGSAAAFDVLLAPAAPALDAPTLPPALQGLLPAPGAHATSEPGLTLPTGAAAEATDAASAAADAQLAATVAAGNAAVRNGTATVNHLARRELPDRELFNLTALAASYGAATAANGAGLGAQGAALATAAAEATQAEAAALGARASAAAARLGDQGQAFAGQAAADAPLVVEAMASEAARFAAGVTVDVSPAQAPVDAALADAHGWAGGTGTQAGTYAALVAADLQAAAAQEVAMQGMVGDEALAAGGVAASTGTAAQAFQNQAQALGYGTVGGTYQGVLDGVILVPFHAVEDGSALAAQLLVDLSLAARDGGIGALDGTAPARARAAAALATAGNVTLAAGAAGDTLGLAAHGLLDDACADPLAEPAPEQCGEASLARGAEAVLQAAEDIASASAGKARSRLATAFDGQASGGVATVNEVARTLTAASTRMAAAASQSVVVVPLTEAEAAGGAALAYATATEARLAALGPSLAADLSAEQGEALPRTVALAAAAAAAAGQAALAGEQAASGLVGAALR